MFEKSPLDPSGMSLCCRWDHQSKAVSKNRNGERRHPCLVPFKMLKGSVNMLLWITWHVNGSYADLVSVRLFSGIPWYFKSFQKVFLSTLYCQRSSRSQQNTCKKEAFHSIDYQYWRFIELICTNFTIFVSGKSFSKRHHWRGTDPVDPAFI